MRVPIPQIIGKLLVYGAGRLFVRRQASHFLVQRVGSAETLFVGTPERLFGRGKDDSSCVW
jgi:hypothetical protein